MVDTTTFLQFYLHNRNVKPTCYSLESNVSIENQKWLAFSLVSEAKSSINITAAEYSQLRDCAGEPTTDYSQLRNCAGEPTILTRQLSEGML